MLKFISLFSGIGGLDIGLHQAGFSPLFCSEMDDNALLTLKLWHENIGVSPIYAGDVNSVSVVDLRKQLLLKKGELDLLAGGPPCQSFSLMGKRKSVNDGRGVLLYKMIEFADEFRPKAILIEQVKGLLSAKDVQGEMGGVFKKLVYDLKCLNYLVYYKVLRASDYGVAQLRDRVFIVALSKQSNRNIDFSFPDPTHGEVLDGDLFGSKKSYLTVSDVIRDLPSPVAANSIRNGLNIIDMADNHVDVTPKRDIERITGVPEGECLARQFHLPSSQRKRLDPKKDTTKFRRMHWNKPALTLRGGEVFYHPTENRYLTPREYMRIHGFPDSHIVVGPIRARSGSVKSLDQHRMIANAVPPPLAKVLGEQIANSIFGECF